MAKVFFEKTVTIGGVPTVVLVNATTPAGNQGQYVASMCNGSPFWWFSSIPSGRVIGCDFTGAPIATGNSITNNGLIDAITATPNDVLTYE